MNTLMMIGLIMMLYLIVKPNKQRKIRGRTFGLYRKLRIMNTGKDRNR